MVIPSQQKITVKDRLMLNLSIGNLHCLICDRQPKCFIYLTDSILGYVLIAAISFLGGSVVFGPEIDYSTNVDVAFSLSVIAQNKPTIFAR